MISAIRHAVRNIKDEDTVFIDKSNFNYIKGLLWERGITCENMISYETTPYLNVHHGKRVESKTIHIFVKSKRALREFFKTTWGSDPKVIFRIYVFGPGSLETPILDSLLNSRKEDRDMSSYFLKKGMRFDFVRGNIRDQAYITKVTGKEVEKEQVSFYTPDSPLVTYQGLQTNIRRIEDYFLEELLESMVHIRLLNRDPVLEERKTLSNQ